jgi:hypothetical protein
MSTFEGIFLYWYKAVQFNGNINFRHFPRLGLNSGSGACPTSRLMLEYCIL